MANTNARRTAAAAALATATVLGLAACGNTGAAPVAAGSVSPATATVGGAAPPGSFTTVDGTTVDVASLRGTPTLLWFIAAGCSSCTASIPAVADHLAQLHADGVKVDVIDLYGDLGSGPKGAAALRKLGTGLAGSRFTDPTWTWGTSSENLSYRYDSNGAPDVYYLLDRDGKITYRNGVPISTMSQLLAHARAAAQV